MDGHIERKRQSSCVPQSAPVFDGIEVGGRDRLQDKPSRPQRYDCYKSGDRCCDKSYGDKNIYKQKYREGFEKGYVEAYERRR